MSYISCQQLYCPLSSSAHAIFHTQHVAQVQLLKPNKPNQVRSGGFIPMPC